LVAGGKRLGWKHGQYKVYWRPAGAVQGEVGSPPGDSPKPLSNLYLTMLQLAGCPVKSFNEGSTVLSELLA
jgi:hypothetical protein